MFDSASCEKKAFSPTERWIEKCSVATHTQLGRISAPNIWALGPLKNCGVLSPRLICSRGWKRSNGGEPLHRAGPWSVSKEVFFFFFIQGRGHYYWGLRGRKGTQHLGDFLFGIGISVFDVGGLGEVCSSGSIWESRHQSPLVSFGTGSFKNSSTKLKRLLRVFIRGSGSFWETVYLNQLFSLIVSHQPIFLLPTANTDDFIFLRCCCLIFHWGCISVF